MNHRVALAFALMLVACSGEPRSNANDVAPEVRASPAVEGAIAPSTITKPETTVAPERAAAASDSDTVRIRLRLISVIDDASLQSTFFHRVRSIALRDDGSMVIAHQGERTLLWLDPAGRLVRSMGRRGSGPGEFRSVSETPPDLEILPDGVVAWDLGARRLTFYSSSGVLLRTSSLSSPGRLLGVIDDMEAVMGGINSIEVKPREYFGVDLQSGEITWRWLGPPARTVPGISFASGTLPNGRPRYSQWSLPDCVPVSLAGAWQGRLFLADASAGTLRSLPIGALQDELPIQPIYRAENRPRMSGIAEKYVSERLAAASPREREEALSGIVSEDGYLPVWKEFVVGLDGTLFLERAACGEEPGARKWEVLTPDGEWLGSLTTPRAFYVRAGARDRIVAIVEDSLGVQRIEVHALEIRTP